MSSVKTKNLTPLYAFIQGLYWMNFAAIMGYSGFYLLGSGFSNTEIGIIIAIALTCFAYSTCIAYYYEGESGLAYLTRKANDKTRKTLIWGIRIIMPIFFFIWSNVTASTAWAISEIMFAIMSWLNLLTLIFLLPNVKKIYDDFFQQLKAGIEVPYFNPKKLGIKNVDLWMDINKDLIAEGKAEAIYEKK